MYSGISLDCDMLSEVLNIDLNQKLDPFIEISHDCILYAYLSIDFFKRISGFSSTHLLLKRI